MNGLKDIVIVIPSLDPDEKMNNVASGMVAAGFKHIVLVDDGSRDECKKYFSMAVAKHPEECHLLLPV